MSNPGVNHNSQNSKEKPAALSSWVGKPVSLGIATFLSFSLLFSLLIFQRFQLVMDENAKAAYEIVNKSRDKLQETLAFSLSAAKTLTYFIDKNGHVNNFDTIAAQIIESGINIDVLQLVPDGIIKYVYPLQGNETVLGYNILKDSATSKEAFKAIEKKEMFFAGPFKLRQGGIGIVGRLPVYRNNKFWGFSAVIIRLSTLLKAAGIDSAAQDGYHFQLSKINPDTKKTEFFLPYFKSLDNSQSVSVNVPNGEWKLSVTPSYALRGFGDIIILAFLGFLFSAFAGLLVWRFALRPKKLNELVLNRTLELRISENRYRSVIERVSDAFIALDKNGNYTYVNSTAGEILGYESEYLVGKNMWEVFPEIADQSFYNAFHQAMKSQEYMYLEEYSLALNKWLENHFYPSEDGMTIFFKDVSGVKEAAMALKRNEEKYQNLIEQASDGIVITNLEGEILEVNNSIVQMIGFGSDELIGHHITEYLPENDKEVIPLRINELMQGKSLLYERRLLKKDGAYLNVEINSKMATTHTLIGFIRDITIRKKNAEILKYQARLLSEVSDAVTSLDMERRIVSWNNACTDLYGFETEEVLGKRIPELVSFKYRNTNNEEVFKQVYQSGQWKGEFYFIHPKTKLQIDLLSSISSLKNAEGDVTGFIITSKDITERKKVEEALRKSNERFELIAEGTNDAVWDHDYTKNETWGNNKLHKIYGLASDEEKIDLEKFFDHIHPEERAGIQERMDQAILNKAISISEIFRFRIDNGGYKIYYDRAYIKYDDEGNPLRILGVMQDITDRENIKKQIIKEKELSDSIINSMPGVFYLYNKEGKFLRWNTSFETVTGYTGEEIKHMHPLDLFDESEKQLLTEKISNVFVAGTDAVEADFLLKNGQKIPYYFTGNAIEYEGETCLVGVGLDFSEKVKNEALIKESEEKFRTIIEQATDGVFIADEDTYFIDVNSAGCRMTGYSLEELKKLKFVDIIPSEDLILNPPKLIPLNSGSAVINERRVKRKDGSVVDIEISAKKMANGRYQSFARDITQRKKEAEILQHSEQKYKLLFYDNPLPMWMTALPGLNIIDVNDAAIIQYGYSREEFLKLSTKDLVYAEDVDFFLEEVKKMNTNNINIRTWRHKKKDGTIIYVESYMHEIIHEGQRVWLGLSYDITEKHEAKEMLEKSYEDIRQLASNLQSIREDERTNIAREIHDELGQQLTGLKMDLHWLTRKINSSDESITRKMTESIELINATISSVRKIATDLRPSILDDLGLVPALEWQGEEFEKRSDTKVEFLNEAGDITVQPATATGIFRIFQELLTNVARHANASQVKAVLYKDDDALYLSVSDNGIGFDVKNTSNKKTLGLLGIKERTLLIGGTYEFKSKLGAGSIAIISIPLINVT